jgi:serine/threonine protein phosphatase PrpC/predicted negative regulator of RcsB-dependent stress response
MDNEPKKPENMSDTFAIEIFCCYARKDQPLMQNLKTHLMPLQRQRLVTLWSDTDINAGENWEEEIKKHLNTAHMILLLVSPDFIASDYCYSTEMARAMTRHTKQEARVVPIILRPTHWKGTPFAVIQALPQDAKPITKWANEDDALYDVVERLELVIHELQIPQILTKAYQHYREKRFDETLALCEQILQIKPDHAGAHLGKGHALLASRQYEECLISLDEAIRLDPKLANTDVYVNKAIAFEKLKQIEKSLVAYEEAIRLCADNTYKATLYSKKGSIFSSAKRYEEARNAYREAVKLDPQRADLYMFRIDAIQRILHVVQPSTPARLTPPDQQKRASPGNPRPLDSGSKEARKRGLFYSARQLLQQAGQIPQAQQQQMLSAQSAQKVQPPVPTLRLDVAQLTDVGRKREHNEDNMAYVIPKDAQVMARKGALFVMVDGGGHVAGEVASEIALDTVSNAYYQDENDRVPNSLLQAIRRANAAIHQRAAENTSRNGMRTTCVAAVLRGNLAYIANVGDSRAYFVRKSRIYQISQDHSQAAEMVRAGLLTEEQARTHVRRRRTVITRSLGTQLDVETDVFREVLKEGDTLLLCTDGLWNLVNDTEILRIINQFPAPRESVYHLIEAANKNGGPDNITALVAHVQEIQ